MANAVELARKAWPYAIASGIFSYTASLKPNMMTLFTRKGLGVKVRVKG